MTTLRTAAQQALEALDKSLYMNDYCGLEVSKHDQPDVTDAIENLRAALAEPPVDDPHGDHWVAIAEAAQKIAASKECGPAEAKALCAALDRLTDAALAEPEPPPEAQTEAEKMAYCAGWWDALEKARKAEPVQEPGCRDDGMPTSAEERHLRRLLALRAAMPHAYYDDGEAQGIEHGISIDFMREPVAHIDAKLRALNVARAIAKQAEPVQEPFGYFRAEPFGWTDCAATDEGAIPLYTRPPAHQPLTVERLRDALVASRIVPPAAVEDPDGYDDGVTLYRIEALHRRLA